MPNQIRTRLGMLPPDWSIQALELVTTKIQDGTHFSPQSTDGPCRYVTSKNIRPGRLDLTGSGWISQQEHDEIYRRCDVRLGDVLITKDGANTGNACLNDEDEPFSLLSSVAFLRADGTTNHSGYILQYLLSPFGQRRLKDLMSGNAISRLTLKKIKAFEVPVASPSEQCRIAEILSTLDETIAHTEALIAKYQQIKTGLMHDLFTRGVTPDGKLRPSYATSPHLYKDSPVGWIPCKWEICKVGECLNGIEAGKSPDCPDAPATGDQWGVLKVGAVDPEGLRYAENKVVLDPQLRNPSFLIRPGDLLFSRANTPDLVGLVCHVTGSPANLMLSDKTLRLQPNFTKCTTRFLFWALQTSSTRRQIENLATGTSGSMKNIGQGAVRGIQLARPQIEEQSRLTLRLDGTVEAIGSEKAQLSKLQNLKRGLMHDLLTGRVRVQTP